MFAASLDLFVLITFLPLFHTYTESQDVYLECNVRASPWVNEIRWWFEGKEIHTNTSAGVIVSGQSLVLQRVQRKHRGRYTCTASNSEGDAESNSVHLRVQYAPICRTSQKILYGAARHEVSVSPSLSRRNLITVCMCVLPAGGKGAVRSGLGSAGRELSMGVQQFQ